MSFTTGTFHNLAEGSPETSKIKQKYFTVIQQSLKKQKIQEGNFFFFCIFLLTLYNIRSAFH